MGLFDASGTPLRLGRLLGRGGEGSVHEVEGRTDFVAKKYHHPLTREAQIKLTAMARVTDASMLQVSTWPQMTLHETAGGQVVGYLMHRININSYQPIHNLTGLKSRAMHFPKADLKFLALVARNLSAALHTLHQAGIVVGDLNATNIFINPQGMVVLIDLDSAQFSFQGVTFTCNVGTPEYTPPELQGQKLTGQIRTPNHDLFALAVFVFQMLFEGRHPFAGVHQNQSAPTLGECIRDRKYAYSQRQKNGVSPPPGTLPVVAFPPNLRELFERAFLEDLRPDAQLWRETLRTLREGIVSCTRNPHHQHHASVACPECQRQAGR